MRKNFLYLFLALIIGWFSSLPACSQQKIAYAKTPYLAKNLLTDRFYLIYGPSTIDVEVYGTGWNLERQDMVLWVRDAVHSVICYYGRYPLSKTLITIRQEECRGVGCGSAFWDEMSNQGRIEIKLGRHTEKKDLRNTWTLTHEMVHLTFPLVNDKYNWLTEGIATYAEPFGRMRMGLISKEEVWKDLIEGLPKGQPGLNDKGLNRTHTWGRTYWGGAMFCLLADIEIRTQTNNRYGLEDALRGIMNKGATAESDLLSAPDILALGDQAVGLDVLSDLYNKMKDKPVTVDLDSIWKKLGVSVKNKEIRFDDSAPLAHIRKSIEKGHH